MNHIDFNERCYFLSCLVMLVIAPDVCHATDSPTYPYRYRDSDYSYRYRDSDYSYRYRDSVDARQTLERYIQPRYENRNFPSSDTQTVIRREPALVANKVDADLAVKAAYAGDCVTANQHLSAAHEKMTTENGEYVRHSAGIYIKALSVVRKKCSQNKEEISPPAQADAEKSPKTDAAQEQPVSTPSVSVSAQSSCGNIVYLSLYDNNSQKALYSKSRSHRNAFPAVMSDGTCGYSNNATGGDPVMTGTLTDKPNGTTELGTYSCWCDALSNGVKALRVTASLNDGTNWAGYGGSYYVQVFPTNETPAPSSQSDVSCTENGKFYSEGASYSSSCNAGGYGEVKHTCTKGTMVVEDSCRYDACEDKNSAGTFHPNGTQWTEDDACNDVHSDGSYSGKVNYRCDNGQKVYVYDWCRATSVNQALFPNATACVIPNSGESIQIGYSVFRNCSGYYGYGGGTITFSCSKTGSDASLSVNLGSCK